VVGAAATAEAPPELEPDPDPDEDESLVDLHAAANTSNSARITARPLRLRTVLYSAMSTPCVSQAFAQH
jgi:hypothetical protein